MIRFAIFICVMLFLTACGQETPIIEENTIGTSSAVESSSQNHPEMEPEETNLTDNEIEPLQTEEVSVVDEAPSEKEESPAEEPLAEESPTEEPPAAEEPSQEHIVEIVDLAFSPSKLEIKAGDTVVFINKDAVKHSATADDESFNTELLAQDEQKPITFSETGEFSYFCLPHPGMKGMIVVK